MQVFVSWLNSLFLIYLLPLIAKSTDTVSYQKPIGTHVLLPCGPAEPTSNLHHAWFVNEDNLNEVANYRQILPNGTLSLYVHMEDSDIVYTCHTYVLVPDGTAEIKDSYTYKVDPQVGAFLKPTVQNVTIDWGTYYTFPCVFSGTLPRDEKMILNGQVVTERRHNITSNSVVECYVKNAVNTVHDKAYITIRPGSQAWNIKYGASTDSYCLPYSTGLDQSSVCLPYLDQLATVQTNVVPYLVARSRLFYAHDTDNALVTLFKAWDALLELEQGNPVDVAAHHRLSYTAWRCVDWAKRLTCALAYPKCENVENSGSDPTHRELPVCPLHCLAVTGLFCLPTLDAVLNSTALDSILSPGGPLVSGPDFLATGWHQLLGLTETRQSGLPNVFSADTFHPSRSDLNSLQTCGLLDEDQGRLRIPESTNADCTILPLETMFKDPTGRAPLPDAFQPDEIPIEAECVLGNGHRYKGSITNPVCTPWATMLGQHSLQDRSRWPGLLALTPAVFPSTIDFEAGTAPVCRNPSGLAPMPFCLNRATSVVRSTDSELAVAALVPCSFIPTCLDLLDLKNISHLPDQHVPLVLGAMRIQIIVACVFVICLACLFLTFYLLWRTNRCGFRGPSDSDLHLSALDPSLLVDEKGNPITLEDKLVKDGVRKTLYRLDMDIGSEQAYLEHRLRWVKRRRRLRQLHPIGQCLMGSCYVLGDCLACRTNIKPHEPDAAVPMLATTHSSSVNAPRAVRVVTKSRLSLRRWWWPFVRKPTQKLVRPTETNKPCSRIRKLTMPLAEGDDDEFEANTLGMQMNKPVAYVANLTNSAQPRSSSTCQEAGLTGVCADCGMTEVLSCELCLQCLNKRRSEWKKALPPTAEHLSKDGLDANHDDDDEDPGAALTDKSIQMFTSGSTDLGRTIAIDTLFNWASMTHLLHPKLKQVCYPRSKLVELQRLAKRAFGWIILARAPNLPELVRRHRFLSGTTTSERLSLALDAGGDQDVKDTPCEADEDGQLVVVKMLINDAGLKTEANFLREAEVLIELSHRNIIQLHGICLPPKPLSLLLEYMPFGDLTTFLRHYQQSNGDDRPFPLHMSSIYRCVANGELLTKLRVPTEKSVLSDDILQNNRQTWLPPVKLTPSDLMEMARGACEAMIYLSDHYYVHRDVATRSFLVGNRMLIKLADFSMCRPIEPGVDLVVAHDVYVPVKWLPLESILEGLFHVDTDVWSFGVFLWELFTYAAEPYPDMSFDEVVGFLDKGGRLSAPSPCPAGLYDLMRSCWASDRRDRPSFTHIRACLADISSRMCSQ